jgi:hypothetical protein
MSGEPNALENSVEEILVELMAERVMFVGIQVLSTGGLQASPSTGRRFSRATMIRNRIQKADRASKRLKNESARNPTKPTPLRPARLPDSGGIIFMSNGVRMKKISHFDRKVKQGKNADCTCPYSPYGHVEGRTIMLMWQRDDVAHF